MGLHDRLGDCSGVEYCDLVKVPSPKGTQLPMKEWVVGASTGDVMGGCQNYGPFLGTLNIRGRIIIGTQEGTIILTTSHIYIYILNYQGDKFRHYPKP